MKSKLIAKLIKKKAKLIVKTIKINTKKECLVIMENFVLVVERVK